MPSFGGLCTKDALKDRPKATKQRLHANRTSNVTNRDPQQDKKETPTPSPLDRNRGGRGDQSDSELWRYVEESKKTTPTTPKKSES